MAIIAMVASYPGITFRHRTASEFANQAGVATALAH